MLIITHLERRVPPNLSTLISYFPISINHIYGCQIDSGHIRHALWLSLPWQGHGLLPICWSRGPQIRFLPVFWSVVSGRWDWSTPTGREATEYSSSGAAHLGVLCCVTFHPLCELSDYTVVGTALGHTLTVGMPAVGPAVSQLLFSPGHQHRSTVLGCFFNTSWIFFFFNSLSLNPLYLYCYSSNLYSLLVITIWNLTMHSYQNETVIIFNSTKSKDLSTWFTWYM